MNTTYTLPQSSFYTNKYPPISLELKEVNQVYRTGCRIIIETSFGKIFVRYNNEFEVDLIVADLTNRLKDYRAQSV